MSFLSDKLIELIKGQVPLQVIPAKVLSVNKTEETCDVEPVNGNAQMFDVQLKAAVDNEKNGMVIFPAKDSIVLVGLINNNVNSAFVVMCSQVDKIEINGGGFGGLVKIEELVKSINRLEQKHNQLATQLEALPVPVSGQVSGPPAPGSYASVKISNLTAKNDLENNKITHG